MWNSTAVVYKTYLDFYNSRPGVAGQPGGGTANDRALAEYYAGRWRPYGNIYDAAKGYDWNVSIPLGLPVDTVGTGSINKQHTNSCRQRSDNRQQHQLGRRSSTTNTSLLGSKHQTRRTRATTLEQNMDTTTSRRARRHPWLRTIQQRRRCIRRQRKRIKSTLRLQNFNRRTNLGSNITS